MPRPAVPAAQARPRRTGSPRSSLPGSVLQNYRPIRSCYNCSAYMKNKHYSLQIFIASLMLASLACSIFIGGPDYPEQTVPVSENEVLNMKTLIEQAMLAGAETGIVTFQI